MPAAGLLFAIVTSIAGCIWAPPARGDIAPRYRVYTEAPGVHRVAFEDLAAIDGAFAPQPSSGLALSHRGQPVPIWVADGGDGVFGPGDTFEFVAELLAGANSTSHDFSATNVYWFTSSEQSAARLQTGDRQAPVSANRGLTRTQHLERDRLLVRIAAQDLGGVEEPELWYWTKLTHRDPEATRIEVDLSDWDRAASRPVELRAAFRALSSRAESDEATDHEVVLTADGEEQARYRWNGKTEFEGEFRPLAGDGLQEGPLTVSVEIPRRRPPGGGDPIVDVAMLNWIELRYPSNGWIGSDQVPLVVEPGPQDGGVRLTSAGGERLLVLGDRYRFDLEPAAGGETHVVFTPGSERQLWVAPESSVRQPVEIVVDRPSNLRTARQADYLMIAHSTLLEATRPLAEFHRASGLAVELIDVQDIYDEFNDGIPHPRAIKDFLSHTYYRWEAPRPRYVLLVGDASWDVKNALTDDANYANWSDRFALRGDRFGAKEATHYPAGGRPGERNLIPAWSIHYVQGHAASDNWFVTLEGDDLSPEMAIGRLPVASAGEVTAIVNKTLRYAARPPAGEWRRRILWITNEDPGYQMLTARVARGLEASGFTALEVYPQPSEQDNSRHQETLLEALADGQLLVVFNGHGGRYIWRTGPPDIKKQHDLFTLDHLDLLEETERLPIVLSLTCHSGPFDHPNADSISEKFLRLESRGAVAVISASWRNNPGMAFSRFLAEEFSRSARIGDAFRVAKTRYQRLVQVELYNLFGDPALPIARPGSVVEIEPSPQDPSIYDVRIQLTDFSGHVVIDWLGADGALVERSRLDASSSRLTVSAPADQLISSLSVYAWDPRTNRDALGSLTLGSSSSPSSERAGSE